jgi:cytochrome c
MKGYLPALAAALVAASIATAVLAAPEQSPAQIGKKHFIRCAACHSTSASARRMTGPHLEGIVGRPVAALPDFAYSDVLRAQNFVWDEARLDAFLKSPHTMNPGMCLTFMGLPKPEDRAALIAYLKSPAP